MASLREQLEELRQRNEAAIVGAASEPAPLLMGDEGKTPAPAAPEQATPKIDAETRTQLEALRSQLDATPDDPAEPSDPNRVGFKVDKNAVRETWQNFWSGVNNQIAKGVGNIAGGLKPSRPPWMEETADPSAAWKSGEEGANMQQAFKDLGLTSRDVNSLTAKWGKEFVDNSVMTMTTWGLAPAMQTAKMGGPVATAFVNKLGELFYAAKPAQVAMDLGAAGGGLAAAEATGSEGARIPGAIAGAVAGGGAFGVAKSGIRAVDNLANKAGRMLEYGLPEAERVIAPAAPKFKVPDTAIRDPSIDPSVSRTFAETQVKGAYTQVDIAMKDAIDRISVIGDNPSAQQTVRKTLERAEEIARNIENRYWSAVPKKNPVPMTETIERIDRMERELVNRPESLPKDLMDRAKELYSPMGKKDGPPTIERIRSFMGEVRRQRMNEEGRAYSGLPVNWELVSNYNRLDSILRQGIIDAYPQLLSLKQAAAVSVKVNDLFSRGVVSDILARRARGDFKIRPSETVDEILASNDLDKVVSIPRRLAGIKRVPMQKNAYPGAATGWEALELKELTAAAENSIRALYREAAQQGGPEGAQKWFAKNEGRIKPLARVTAEIQKSTDTITKQMEQKAAIAGSALEKYAGEDSAVAIRRVFNSGDPAKVGRELRKTFQQDPFALEGYRAGLIDHLYRTTHGSPIRLKEMINTSRYRSLLKDGLEPEQFARLEKIVDVSHRLAIGDEKNLRHAFFPVASIMSRIVGAHVGRKVSDIFGGGTLQPPAIMAQTFRNATEKMLKTYSPNKLVIEAVMDPRFEAMLLKREPKSTKEMRQFNRWQRRLIGAMEGERQRRTQEWFGNENDTE